jgi:hypothetical protein
MKLHMTQIRPGDFMTNFSDGRDRVVRVIASDDQKPDFWVCRDVLTDRELSLPSADLAELTTRPAMTPFFLNDSLST